MSPTMGIWAITSEILAAFSLGLLVWRFRWLRGTTLAGPGIWAALAIVFLAVAGIFMALQPQHPANPSLRLICATGTLCPLMAVLGARRPHHLAWNFVVASLWIVAALPALESIFLGREEALDIGAVRGWFLWLMIALGVLNYLPTRYGLSAIFVALGQVAVLTGFLPGVVFVDPSNGLLWASLFFLLAIILAIWSYPNHRKAASDFDTRWLEFRDAFGSLWGVRILERINAAARTYDWPFSLTWTGFYFHDADTNWNDVPPKTQSELQQTMENLLRRFVNTSTSNDT